VIKFLFTFIAGIILIAAGNRKTAEISSPPAYLIPPSNLIFFSLGYNEPLADLLWLRTIQDFDFCEAKTEQTAKSGRCKRGWVYHMIDAITELAPRFREPYVSGGLMLTVIVDDIAGASAIYDKAMAAFPNDGRLAYYAAYQALIEEHDPQKASNLLVIAGRNGLPPWVFALAANLQKRAGQLALAKSILEDSLKSAPSGHGAERIQQRLDEVNAEIAKQQAAEQAKPNEQSR
jgi:hypothetical protein